jgi:hypothetical protein
MYDCPPLDTDPTHEVAYLIVAIGEELARGPEYRVSPIDGERRIYDDVAAVVADLDLIEARRCPGCAS